MVRNNARTRNNTISEKNQQTKDEITYTGEIPNMNKILKLWGGIWKDDNRTNKPVWIKESGNRISKTIKEVQRFSVSDKDTRKVIKNRTAPGVDSIGNF